MKNIHISCGHDALRRDGGKMILHSSGIGSFIGILPAEGLTVTSMIGYNEARRWPEKPKSSTRVPLKASRARNRRTTRQRVGAVVPTLAPGIGNAALASSVVKQAIDDWYAPLVIGADPFDYADSIETMQAVAEEAQKNGHQA